MSNLRDKILGAKDLVEETVHVEVWGVDVLVRGLTARQRDEFESSILREGSKGRSEIVRENIRAKLVVQTCFDPETKEKLFSPDDAGALGDKSAAALDKLFSAAQRLSGITGEDVDELAKNSEATPADSSSTG